MKRNLVYESRVMFCVSNVGGTRIDVLRRTLTLVEGSLLATKFGGRWGLS